MPLAKSYLGGTRSAGVKFAGTTGLDNLGNTCYLNSTLQVHQVIDDILVNVLFPVELAVTSFYHTMTLSTLTVLMLSVLIRSWNRSEEFLALVSALKGT